MKQGLRIAVLLGVLSGCSSTPPPVGDLAPQLKDRNAEQAYQEILTRYTARGEIYDGFDTRFFAGTTYQALPFREARVRRLAQFQVLPPPRVEELLAQERAEAAQFHEFFLGVHVNDPSYNDFDHPRSIWRLALLTPMAEVEPVSIDYVGRGDLNMRAMYPYMGEFWVGYRVRFPAALPGGAPVLPPEAQQVTLRIASTLGKADLVMAAR